ncbi:uncharacterized protein LOC111832446 [Capsella rubella]|uniref:uncharacterized protein LOC111832446 n=1 Tax=Capsella rubella TaxID=81985 RepID=UPI000CD51CE7|nr:uncharacterized protein LOC111832446 [Capsella rubella]
MSGQQINFDKSSLQFGHKVDAAVRTEVQETLGMVKLGGMGSYLGLPESLGGAKTQVFSFVRDRLNTHINGWSAKLLSKGGKEVMIKSVASALPTYVMSCFRLPKSITSKLTSAVAKFWWSSNGYSGGMHWRAWDKLCSSKCSGGLGFRDVNDFYTALLAKQLWRLIDYPNSLFAKVFKGSYYRNATPMEQVKSYSPSYGWRSMVSARSLVMKGLIKRVGTEDSISVWTDPWIPAQLPRPAKSCISVLANLSQRGINCDTRCGRCGDPMETVNHVIFDCPPARQTWALANVPVGPIGFPTASVFANMDYILRILVKEEYRFCPWILWYIWKSRNDMVFDNLDKNPSDVVRLATDEARTWYDAQLDDSNTTREGPVGDNVMPGLPSSIPSRFSGYRCFIDGSWKATDMYAGLGWFCQHAHNSSTTMGASNLRRSLSPLHSEVEALVWAMRCMIGHDFREVAFLTDCSDLVKMVSSPHEWPAFSVYLEDIKNDREEFSSFSLSFIPRNLNVKADYLARKARSSPHLIKFVNNCPSSWLI